MSSKRRADKYITDQNWDQEDEAEEVGRFEAASKDVLNQRTFKKAKRRITQQQGEVQKSSAFKGFSGLTAAKQGGSSNGFQGFKLHPTSSVFTLPNKLSGSAGSSSSSNGNKSPLQFSKQPIKQAFPLSKDDQPFNTDGGNSPSSKKMSDYNRHLSALNRSVSKWIAEHVGKNPLCDLTPIFDDYQQHFSNIEDKYGSLSSSPSDTSLEHGDDSSPVSTQSPKMQIPVPSQSARAETPPSNPLGITLPSSSSSSIFKGFGSSQPSTSGFTGFQFGSKMVAASSTKMTIEQDTATSAAAEEEEYVPPKPQSTVVEEKDAFYTKRCKLFYMKDGAYADKGVGNIYLKPVESSTKTQLIVRADTTLGHILLNIVLNSAMPVAKQGKNNVVISCIPNPPIDEKESNKVIPMLIRVKTSEDADELVELLNKKKQEAE